MAQLQLQPAKGSKGLVVKAAPHVDMTPMVDLGFLLITFFIFTSTLFENKALKLFMPADGSPMPIGASASLTLLLGAENKVYAYEGSWEAAAASGAIQVLNYDVRMGLGAFIRKKQEVLRRTHEDGKDALMLLIKPLDASTYTNLVDVLDEVAINGVKRYAVMDAAAAEAAYVDGR
ncbi:MAG TPA: biopolymer transporter ExbD [Chitinophagaceae bacterium]|jgi:biopolymer transport protein ExbD|nr:biopolymer transporter ExbD [Chitinophagaceae bacterium]